MGFMSKYREINQQIATKSEQLAIERAQSSVKKLLESDQWKLSALALPESNMAVDAIIESSIHSVLEPKAQLMDTLRAKGFRPAEIRKVVHNYYDLHCAAKYGPSSEKTHEEMLGPVAEFFCAHQEIYNSLDPDSLRGD